MISFFSMLAVAATCVAAQPQCANLGSVVEATCLGNARFQDATNMKLDQITKTQGEENMKLSKRLDQVDTAIELLSSVPGNTSGSSKASTVQSDKLSNRVNVIEAKIEGNKGNFSDLSSALAKVQMEIKRLKNQTSEGYCQMRYNGKCFWLVSRNDPWIIFDQATDICASLGGEPANIYSEEHAMMMVEHLRSYIFNYKGMYVWIGMKYDPEAKTALLSDGRKAPFQKWGPNYPDGDYCCNIYLQALDYAKSSHQYMYTARPSTPVKGVLCEK